MPRTHARRLAPRALLVALSLIGWLAAGDRAGVPPSAAQSRTPVRFEFSTGVYRVSEGDGGVTVTVLRAGGADGQGDLGRAVSVEYQASNGYLGARGCAYLTWVGTAAPGADYEAARGTLAFAAGEASKTFRVVVKDDTQIESRNPETVFLSLDFSAEAPPDSEDCFGRTALINIHDDDPAAPPAPPPSGKRQIAFGTNRDGNYEIYTMDEDGANPRRLTNSLVYEGRPAYSPDGRRIAFVRETDTGPAVFLMNADGTNAARLTGAVQSAADPAWSPDGSRIAFTGSSSNLGGGIFVVNADGTGLVNLTKNAGDDFGPAWSPDGRRIAFTGRRGDGTFGVYVMDSDGANVRRLVENYSREPAWSPDGAKIAYAEGTQHGHAIAVVNADGTNKKLLTSATAFASDLSPAWSPDGAKIAFVSGRDNAPGVYEIYSMNADGTSPARLTNNAAHESQPAWQPGEAANPAAPVLLTEAGTGRAVALDSVTFALDPFAVGSPSNLLAADRRTRVSLFAANVTHPASAADISVQAEDSAGRTFQLPVEHVGRVPGFDWLTQVVVRLPDEAATADHLWLGLNVRGTLSNKAVITMQTRR